MTDLHLVERRDWRMELHWVLMMGPHWVESLDSTKDSHLVWSWVWRMDQHLVECLASKMDLHWA